MLRFLSSRNKANKRARIVGNVVVAITETAIHVLPADVSARAKPLVSMDRGDPGFSFREVNTATDGSVLEFHSKDPKRDEHRTFELASLETGLIVTHLKHADTPMLMNVSKFVDELLHLMTLEDYNEGEYVVRAGDPGRCMYFVSAGTIEIEIPAASGEVKTVTLREGSYFGEIALFLSKTGKRTASVRAATPVQLLVLTKETCNSVLHRFPHMEKAFRELGSARLRNNDESSGGGKGKGRRSAASAATPSWMKRISGKVTKRRVTLGAPASGPAVRSKTSQKPRFMEVPQEPSLPLPGAPDEAALPPILDAGSWDADAPARVFAPLSDPAVLAVEDTVAETNWFARIFCDQAYSLFMAKIDERVVLVTIFVSRPPGLTPGADADVLASLGPESELYASSTAARNTSIGVLDLPLPKATDDSEGSAVAGSSSNGGGGGDDESSSDAADGEGANLSRRRSSTLVLSPEDEATRNLAQVRQLYWVMVWEKKSVRRWVLESESKMSFGQVLGSVDPGLGASAKNFRKVEAVSYEMERALCTIENGEPELNFKLGVLYAREGQVDENDMFGNKDGSPAFREFLEQIGERVRLKGYSGYCAQLDTKYDKSGLHSYRTSAGGYEVMFHVSTELQYDPTDDQYIQRKRFIGNDIVVIVFVDGPTTYATQTMKSQYTNILVVVTPDPTDSSRYRVAVTRQRGLRRFGPLPARYYRKGDGSFAKWLLTTCLNGEHATYVSPEFLVRDRRTRNNLLNDFYDAHWSTGAKKRTT
ncbi:uncharacterized protein AMSG_11843 [Thecamonas trahens ATCC 50062]|uniref:Rap-GAP domain-containing protein n=1 Tax=Thecamonas trahens ATCC 50062 TaxID=461836 RepID=A0A0L0D9R5_THETB|nr:hypothetical protein AMSG_11843 [Thecamonas trahens ATCC 50062]KNC49064.1 hypothetical protein AMSG_11843 [Thecamonas trahens ATCC 50062]|eukprot:XP_013758222.1 hypothetical protein AMSG_11843 [Thecamonas trahens ATCC 50062]